MSTGTLRLLRRMVDRANQLTVTPVESVERYENWESAAIGVRLTASDRLKARASQSRHRTRIWSHSVNISYAPFVDYLRERGSIQADLALRAGNLIGQYRELSNALPPTAKYDATLAVAVLNLLLTNCAEALAVMVKDQRTHLLWPAVQTRLLTSATSTFPPPKDGSPELEALRHLRNAVSHPVPVRRRELSPVTGYTSFPDRDAPQAIGGFEFVSAPWADHDGVSPKFRSKKRSNVASAFGRFAQRYQSDGLSVAESPGPDGFFTVITSDTGRPYLPVFRARLSLPDVEMLAREVANFLAHGSLPAWDGSALEDLLLA